uniref:Peptidase S9 prolyl oligopeptidase catalytic domain-containing protein n=1 Tax=Aureoumbra lagunensis TaxID=44058 RepID=A0A7S3NPC2_9STRA
MFRINIALFFILLKMNIFVTVARKKATHALTRPEFQTMLNISLAKALPLNIVEHSRWEDKETKLKWTSLSMDTLVTRRPVGDESEVPSQRRLPMLLVQPKHNEDMAVPVVIFVHGTAKGKSDAKTIMTRYALDYGAAGISFDVRYHGARGVITMEEEIEGSYLNEMARAKREGPYFQAIIDNWRSKPGEQTERPFIFDTVLDATRVLDFIESRSDLFDISRIGMTGVSLGGTITWFTAAADERIAVAVPLIGFQWFAWGRDNDAFHGRVRSLERPFQVAAKDLGKAYVDRNSYVSFLEKVAPGLLHEYDAPATLPLISPRPFLIISGEHDPRCPLYGVASVFLHALDTVYTHAKHKLALYIGRGIGHDIDDTMWGAADAWFIRFLFNPRANDTGVDDLRFLLKNTPIPNSDIAALRRPPNAEHTKIVFQYLSTFPELHPDDSSEKDARSKIKRGGEEL